ncbi:DegV family protein [Salisediminibacterium halotolerans]|uniref:DegV family protein n=1 Tax=Salisediminibacterium halotolerans TaxID=517425 RepID=UPI000EB13005|nr:DegV family protein [Salisediminibacterium halotolerans]RLJ75550.1 DegV family protein with EDD domain [Actinophytocola xinjiangensis]RPE89403.1 DegV family protein with EDD domain [Salisediminibacterium halotolerans]TWG36163.1 DegV family protein with EDD domain [Salisediminibacterium halotolerans]GEL07639.1 hypothetical protein SHA02_10550 [Salisediminibacterium halotolerans]
MSEIAIVTDSTAYLSAAERSEYGITMVPLNVIFGDETFQEETDITAEQFYEKMKSAEQLPTTSQPPVGLFEETFSELAKTYDDIIVVTLSSGISGAHQTALTAANVTENARVHVFDSEISCYVQGFFVLTAAKLAEKGKSVKEIMDHLYDMKTRTRAYFMADDLSHLHRGGRLNGAQLIVGSMLQIKPVLHFENKVIVPYEKVRTEKKALAKIRALLDEDAAGGEALEIAVIHANRPDKAEEIAAEIRGQHPACNVTVSHFGPVIGTHIGEGSLGIGWTEARLTV